MLNLKRSVFETSEKRKKKKPSKTAVVEVQPDSHIVEEKIVPKQEVEVQVAPTIGAFDGVSCCLINAWKEFTVLVIFAISPI